jgi:hypothetical protein
MKQMPIVFPLSETLVGHLLLYSDELTSVHVQDPQWDSHLTGHAIGKHVQMTFEDFKERAVREQGRRISAFRDFTEMRRSGAIMLNSAWGRFAISQTLKREPGQRVIFEAEMAKVPVWFSEEGNIRSAVVSLARMVLESAGSRFELPLKVQTFFPLSTYLAGRPRCEIRGFRTFLEPREP